MNNKVRTRTMAISDIIKQIAKAKGTSQKELGEKLGLTKQNMNNKMKRNTFSPDELAQIAESVGMKLAFVDADMTCYYIERTSQPAESAE